MEHIDALRLRLSNERTRLSAATKPAEIAQRKVWVAQIEREIAAEEAFLASTPACEMSDDELIAALTEAGQ